MARTIGIDLGGNAVNVTAFDGKDFLVPDMLEVPSLVREGPETTVQQLEKGFNLALEAANWNAGDVQAVGLDTPGPASASGVFNSEFAVNFANSAWASFDVRGALEKQLRKPVAYLNDGNAAAYYAHHHRFGTDESKTSVSLIIGTGLGGGIVIGGRVVVGKVGFAAELGHTSLPVDWNPVERFEARCNCGRISDLESIASLSGSNSIFSPTISRNTLTTLSESFQPERRPKRFARSPSPEILWPREIFQAQTWAIGAHIDQMINVLDMDAVFIGGGGVQTTPELRAWFLESVRTRIPFRAEQKGLIIEIAPDGDMAGARGAAVYASTLS